MRGSSSRAIVGGKKGNRCLRSETRDDVDDVVHGSKLVDLCCATVLSKYDMTPDALAPFRRHPRHIRTTVGHFYGRVDYWDVVNEALSVDNSGRMENNVFLRKLGPGYLDDCFRVAHQVWMPQPARALGPNALCRGVGAYVAPVLACHATWGDQAPVYLSTNGCRVFFSGPCRGLRVQGSSSTCEEFGRVDRILLE